jgi:FkbH-like protein
MGSHANLEEYLRSLCTVARISIVGDDAAPRVAQLTQKTNQFNLTTRRYTQAEIGRFIADPNYRVISMSVCDKFGDMGLTGVFIARNENDVAVVDSYLLSCRVLGRQLEFAFIEACIAKTEQDFAPASWRAEYRVTRKNEQVADFWDQVGFVRADRDGETFTYVKDVGTQSVDYSSIITVIVE